MKITVRIFPLYNKESHDIEQIYIKLIWMGSRQKFEQNWWYNTPQQRSPPAWSQNISLESSWQWSLRTGNAGKLLR